MNPTEIEFAVKALAAEPYDPRTFPFDLIAIYNAPKVTVSKLKTGQTNVATSVGDVLWKKKLFFRSAAPTDDVAAVGDDLVSDPLTAKHKPRFILVTNGNQVHIRDLTLDDTCNTEFMQLDESSDFLLPLAGFERRSAATENPADVKAAKRLSKLYDALLAANPTWSDGNHTHELNLFMTRILFCFYAEDTGIFDTSQLFTNTVAQHTKEDGTDLAPLLDRLFRVMNIECSKRPATTSAVDARFPYVNGSLFEATLSIPAFNRTSRRLFLECGELDWQTINTDIFGSMIQTITEPGMRGDIGMHYTSVPNIMKLLHPFFLDELHGEFEKAKHNIPKIEHLLSRLGKIRIFDPACGSGNFLSIAYKELRKLELQIMTHLAEIAPNNPLRLSNISLCNFFGIDIIDFACETAKLSLWVAEYQMNSAFKTAFGTARSPLPLGKITTIQPGNALRLNWTNFLPNDPSAETYICGNPPYKGHLGRAPSQNDDLHFVCAPRITNYGDLDYVSCWLLLASDFISNSRHTKAAFVTTNAICQGEQVPLLWPYLMARTTIDFAYTPFKWANQASHNAAVTCTIIGLSSPTTQPKRLYIDDHVVAVDTIAAYLVPAQSNVIVTRESEPLNDLPEIVKGTKPIDGGHLILSPADRQTILASNPEASEFIYRFYSAEDLLYNHTRYILMISDERLSYAENIPYIKERLRRTAQNRLKGGKDAQRLAGKPHRLGTTVFQPRPSIVLPEVCADRRHYLPIALLTSSDVVSNQLYITYDPPDWLCGVLSSRIHWIWAITVGRITLNTLRYSTSLIYNTLPLPNLSHEQKQILKENTKVILKTRAQHPGKTLAWLYDPETMPINLSQAHLENDAYIEEYIYGRKFKDDTHRLEHLFAMYTRMKDTKTHEGTLFANSRTKARK